MTQKNNSIRSFFVDLGSMSLLAKSSFRTLFKTKPDVQAFIQQMYSIGFRSLGMMSATAVFVGIVMVIQFILTLQKYGAEDTVGRIVGISEARELAPSLTSLVVGCRVAAGIAAELGSMTVTEQVDALRALGADPMRKLVVPRVLASVISMPLLTTIALLLGIVSAMVMASVSYGISMRFFWSSVFEVVRFQDFLSGLSKTPVFGLLIAIIGSYYGLNTRGGTAGVGRSTTKAVVVVSIAILISDALLTQLFVLL